jgi:hypothetical protein
MRLSVFLLGLLLLLLLLRHDVLEHGPQAFNLTELVSDLWYSDMLVCVSCVPSPCLSVRVGFAMLVRGMIEAGRAARGSRMNVRQ